MFHRRRLCFVNLSFSILHSLKIMMWPFGKGLKTFRKNVITPDMKAFSTVAIVASVFYFYVIIKR